MKMKFGALVVAGSGKIGGHVASKNRGGSYLRTKTTPSNPQTAKQQEARGLLASLSSQWKTLTEEQRLSWDNAVSQFASSDIFGDMRNPSGINLFVKLNANLVNTNRDVLLAAPSKIETISALLDYATGDVSAMTLEAGFSDSALDGEVVLVSATAAQSQGVKFVKNKLRVIGYFTVAGGVIDIYADYVAKFGVPTVGANIVISARHITTTGQAGVSSTVKAVISA